MIQIFSVNTLDVIDNKRSAGHGEMVTPTGGLGSIMISGIHPSNNVT